MVKGNTMKKVEALKELIEKLNDKNSDTVHLNPVISQVQVKAFEKKYKISLPKDYVEFITLVGDGAVIKSDVYGTQKIVALGSYESMSYPLERINLPFPLEKSWMPDWGDGIEGVQDEDAIEQLMAERWEMIGCQGNITVMEENTCNSVQWILIVKGTHRGEIWQITEYGVFRLAKCSFVRWLELFLTNKLDDFIVKCKKIEYPQEGDLVERCKDFIKKQKIVMNPPISLMEIHTFEERHNVLLPDEYTTLLTEVGNGAKKSTWSLSKIYSLYDNDFQQSLAKPFLIQTDLDYNRIFLNERGYERSYGYRGEKTIWECIFDKKDYEGKKAVFPWALSQFQLLHGCMPIIGKGTAADEETIIRQYILILNGKYKGEIWRLTKETISRRTNTEIPINALTIMECITYRGA